MLTSWVLEFQTVEESWRRANLFTGIPQDDTTLVPPMDLAEIVLLLQTNQPNGKNPVSLNQLIVGFSYFHTYCPERIRLRNIETGETLPYVGLFA